MKVKIIGLGGVGCSLLKTLPQFLTFWRGHGKEEDGEENKTEMVLIDGDSFEAKNRDRQTFVEVGNKAEVLHASLSQEWPRLWFEAMAEYVTADNVVVLIREGDVLFLAVDNHATRKLVSDRCQELCDVLLISGGNEFTDGNIQVFWRKDGQNMTLPLASEFHKEILYPQDKSPSEMGCEELAERGGEPQLLITNNAVAVAMLNAFYAFLEGKLNYDEVYLDILTGNTRQVQRESYLNHTTT